MSYWVLKDPIVGFYFSKYHSKWIYSPRHLPYCWKQLGIEMPQSFYFDTRLREHVKIIALIHMYYFLHVLLANPCFTRLLTITVFGIAAKKHHNFRNNAKNSFLKNSGKILSPEFFTGFRIFSSKLPWMISGYQKTKSLKICWEL